MSKFCPINQPPEKSVKPTSEELPLSGESSRHMRDTIGQVFTTGQCRVVIPHPQRQRKTEGNIAQACAKRKSIPQKNRKKSKSLKLQPQRQQAPRTKKVVHSIERSPRKSDASSTPGTDGDGSDYVPPLPDSPATTQSSAPTSPPRRSPRKNLLSRPNNRFMSVSEAGPAPSPSLSSPQTVGALPIIKQDHSLDVETAITAKSPSPSIWSRKVRQKRYDEDDFVEIPRVDFDLERSKKEYKNSKKETLRLKQKKEVLLAEKRKERGKRAGKVTVEKTRECTKKTGKRKAEDTADNNETRKRHKSHKSQDLNPKADLIEGEGKISTEPRTSRQTRAQTLLKGKKTRSHNQRYQRVDPEAADRPDIFDTRPQPGCQAKSSSKKGFNSKKVQRSLEAGADVREIQSHERSSGSRASRHSKRPKSQKSEGWREPDKRPASVVSKSALQRSFYMLLKYFAENPERVPELASWRRRGSELEFLKYVRQISSCPGLVYPGFVTSTCKRILEGSKRWNRETLQSIFESSQRDLSTDRQNNSNLRRAQSSIPPLEFYGRIGLMPTTEKTSSSMSEAGTAPPTISEPENPPESINSCTLSKSLPRRGRSKSGTKLAAPRSDRPSSPAVVVESSMFLTPPNSSPLDTPSRLRPLSGSPPEHENNGAGQIAEVLIAQSSRIDQTHCIAQRRRYQSMPINILDENAPVNERIAPPSSLQRQRGNALEEISNNAILHKISDMSRKLVSVEEKLDQELLSRTRTAPVPVQPPATAQAPIPTTQPPLHTSVQDPNGPDQAAGKKKKRPTVRLLKSTSQPELNRHAPPHPDLTDKELIEIGKIVNHYERHRRAPHVFKWNGHLYKDYDYLLLETDEGKSVWTPEQLKRLIGG